MNITHILVSNSNIIKFYMDWNKNNKDQKHVVYLH